MITISEYFEGAVKSLGYQSPEGKSTIGVIESGEYEFGTLMHETMLIIEGELEAGQGAGLINDIPTVEVLLKKLLSEYEIAKRKIIQ